MKKAMTLLLAALIGFALLAGCAANETSSQAAPQSGPASTLAASAPQEAQEEAPDDAQPQVEWTAVYDGPDSDDDRMFGVAELAGGGYVACADSENADDSETATLLKYSSDGTQEWATQVPDTHLQAVIETEAGLLAVGSTTSQGAPFFEETTPASEASSVSQAASEATGDETEEEGEEAPQPDTNAAAVLFDPEGNILWAKSFGGTGYDVFTGHFWSGSGAPALLPGGNFLILGNTSSDDGDFAAQHVGANDGVLAEVDAAGNLVSYSVFGGTGNDSLHEVKVAEDGGLYVAGTMHPAVDEATEEHLPADGMFEGLTPDWDEDNVFVSKLDAQRNILWTTMIPSYGSWVVGLALAEDGVVVAADALEESAEDAATSLYIKKLDTDGSIVWENQYDNNKDDAARIFVTSLQAAADGSYLLSGEVHYDSIIDEGSEGMRGWLGSIGPDGTLLWERNFEGSDYELHIHAAPAADGGTILAAQQASEKGDWDAVLLKYAPYAG